jgi:hypothetical protein
LADEEHKEPTNKQLANFLLVHAKRSPELANLQLNAPTLERLMDQNPMYRAGALRHHRRFQEELNELSRKVEVGELQCEHILNSGKKCPNRNEPGRMFCGLHGHDD